jgi:hypothetical protein
VWERLAGIGAKHRVPLEVAPLVDAEASLQAVLTPAHAQEITRYGGMELHNISSLMGGIVAQVSSLLITSGIYFVSTQK